MSRLKITPNFLTGIRIVLAVLTFFLMWNPSLVSRILASVTFTSAGLTDIWDGRLARKKGMITPSGTIMDPIADKILILGTFILLSALGFYPFWVLAPIFFREIAVTLVRLYLLTKKIVVQAEMGGKIKVISQIFSLGVTYLCLLFRDYLGRDLDPVWVGVLVSLNYFFLTVATGVTLISGWDFFKKNWKFIHA